MHRMFTELLRILILALVINAPALALAQAPPPGNPIMQLPKMIASSPGVLGVETAMTESGKAVIFAWFENKKAALAWYYSDTHRMLMKMGGGTGRPEGPLANVPDDGRPILAIASVTMTPPDKGGVQRGPFPPISQIAIELYAPLPGGLAAGGRFAPSSVPVPGLLQAPMATSAPQP